MCCSSHIHEAKALLRERLKTSQLAPVSADLANSTLDRLDTLAVEDVACGTVISQLLEHGNEVLSAYKSQLLYAELGNGGVMARLKRELTIGRMIQE